MNEHKKGFKARHKKKVAHIEPSKPRNFVAKNAKATTSGADLLGAANSQYNAALGASNMQNAAQANLNSGLFGLLKLRSS